MNCSVRNKHDYGSSNISVGTNLETEEEINLSLTGIWFRMNDKDSKNKESSYEGRSTAVDESIEDASFRFI